VPIKEIRKACPTAAAGVEASTAAVMTLDKARQAEAVSCGILNTFMVSNYWNKL